MKRSILWLIILMLCVSIAAVFMLAGCKKEAAVETTAAAAETTSAETTAAETSIAFPI